jgi:hypothetical protein
MNTKRRNKRRKFHRNLISPLPHFRTQNMIKRESQESYLNILKLKVKLKTTWLHKNIIEK